MIYKLFCREYTNLYNIKFTVTFMVDLMQLIYIVVICAILYKT
jgi:hypothetical protein